MASFTSGIKIQGVDIALSTQKYAKVSNYLDKQFGQFDEYYAIDLSEYGIHFNGRIPNEFRFIKKIDSTSTMKFEPYKPLATTSNPEGVLKYKGYALPLAYANDISKPKYDTTTNPSTRNSKDPGKWGNKRWQGSSVSKVWFKKNTSGDGIMTSTTSSSSGFSLMTYQNMMILELCAGGGAGGGAWGNIFGWNAGTGGGGGAACNFIVKFTSTSQVLEIGIGKGGSSTPGKNGAAGGNSYVKLVGGSGNIYTLTGGGGGKSESGEKYNAVGKGGTCSIIQHGPIQPMTSSKGGDGGYRDQDSAASTTSQKHGKAADTDVIYYMGIFDTSTNSSRTGGGPYFRGKSGETRDRDGGGGGGCLYGSVVNASTTSQNAPDIPSSAMTIYGWGGGSNGGALCHGQNYNAWGGWDGCLIAHYQATY